LIGLVSTAAQWLVVLAYRAAPASLLAPFSYVQLIFSGLLGFVMFGTVPDRWTFLGAGIIAASGLYTAHRERVRAQGRVQAR
jgi:drug/metabolite transporter (DMT)-like permease